MKYLLDANAVIALLKGHDTFLTNLRRHSPEDIGISSIVSHELLSGAFKSRRAASNLKLVSRLPFEILPFDRDDSRRSGEIRAILSSKGQPIGPYDLLIAGQALSRNLILVTHNTGEFSRIDGLRLEDWEMP